MPVIVWPAKRPVMLATVAVLLPSVILAERLAWVPFRLMPPELPLVKRSPAALRDAAELIVPSVVVKVAVLFIAPKAAISAPLLFQVPRLVMLFVPVLSGATEVKLLPVSVHGLVA